MIDSPLHAIAAYERDLGIPEGHVNRVVVDTGPSGAWSRLERGEVSMGDFHGDFERECREAGHAISAAEMMRRIGECGPRPAMLRAIERIREAGLPVAALTNNWAPSEEETAVAEGGDTRDLKPMFDVFIESSVVGLRKPDPRIYELVCSELSVAPAEAVFLDDIGRNLKAARALGMGTIKVDEPGAALRELSAALGVALA